ncbi:MAG TPA: hypothetical protein PKY53_05070 [Clostridia bacterium]|nr:hypothetical protein [Clostridia bacterium]
MYDLVQQEFIKRNELRSASKAGEQAEFDKDIFTKLVDLVKIKSREIMEQLDELFKQRDEFMAEQSDGALSKSQYKMLTDFLKNEQKQTEFDKDVFTKLVDKVIVHSREEITFVFKDGTEIKGTKE